MEDKVLKVRMNWEALDALGVEASAFALIELIASSIDMEGLAMPVVVRCSPDIVGVVRAICEGRLADGVAIEADEALAPDALSFTDPAGSRILLWVDGFSSRLPQA